MLLTDVDKWIKH